MITQRKKHPAVVSRGKYNKQKLKFNNAAWVKNQPRHRRIDRLNVEYADWLLKQYDVMPSDSK